MKVISTSAKMPLPLIPVMYALMSEGLRTSPHQHANKFIFVQTCEPMRSNTHHAWKIQGDGARRDIFMMYFPNALVTTMLLDGTINCSA